MKRTTIEIGSKERDNLKIISIKEGLNLKDLSTGLAKKFIKDYSEGTEAALSLLEDIKQQ